MIAKTPKPPYYAVIFTSTLIGEDNGYSKAADRMITLAQQQDGYIGIESARGDINITISYWRDLESIKSWKENAEHSIVQEKGRSEWYKNFKTRISKVERDYEFEK